MKTSFAAFALLAALAFVPVSHAAPAAATSATAPGVTRVPVTFSGGHETDPRDGGRPVVLIAAALGVPDQVFRDAFGHVRPAKGGAPEAKQVQENKHALMSALGKYGITNERLDTVSNYYRYQRSRGELWKVKPAVANALVKDGKVIGYEIVSAGAGYSSPLTVTVPNVKDATAEVKLSFGKSLETNGAIASISLSAEKK